MKFDIVLGNPPYGFPKVNGKSSGNVIWDDFVKKAVTKHLKEDGTLTFVHPPTWRKPVDENSDINIWYHLSDIKYLNINGDKEGQRVFGAATKFDWYTLIKNDKDDFIEINDINCEKAIVDKREISFIPNTRFDLVKSLCATSLSKKQKVIFDSSYHAATDITHEKQTDVFCYPVVHSTTGDRPTLKFSSRNDKGHFGIPKVIFGESGVGIPILDEDGKYGMTQGAIGLPINNKEHGEKLIEALTSDLFGEVLNACTWSGYRIEHRLFRNFRADWHEIIIRKIETQDEKVI